jgi:hypothetical protein
MLPISFAVEANAPASMKIHIISIIFSELAPRENIFILSFNGLPCKVIIPTMLEARKAIIIGTL